MFCSIGLILSRIFGILPIDSKNVFSFKSFRFFHSLIMIVSVAFLLSVTFYQQTFREISRARICKNELFHEQMFDIYIDTFNPQLLYFFIFLIRRFTSFLSALPGNGKFI